MQPTPQSGNHHVQDPVEQLASPPPPRQDTTPGTTNNTNDSSSTFNRNDDDEDNDDSGTGQSVHRSISTLSSVSLDSVQLRQNHYAAFSKVRTVNTNIPQDISEEWRKYDPPSLTRGDWRSFGPTEAVLTVAEQCGSGTEGEINMRHLKKELEKAVSSLWKGTIWLTEVCLPLSLLRSISWSWLRCRSSVADDLRLFFPQRPTSSSYWLKMRYLKEQNLNIHILKVGLIH